MKKKELTFKGVFLLLFASFLNCFGQVCWKLAADGKLYFLILGIFLYGASALAAIIGLRFGNLSTLYPIMSSGYIFALIVGYYFFDEIIKPIQMLGVLIIISGLVLINKGKEIEK